jgi:hypothetical protein
VRTGTRIALGAASLVAAAGLAVAGGTPAFALANGTIAASQGANVFNSPGGQYVTWIAGGAAVTIWCQTTGPSVNGIWGPTNIWDRITSGAEYPEFVSDGFVYTGSNGFVAPHC